MKLIRNSVLLLLLCVAAGFALLAAAYALPTSAMQDECYESVHVFTPEERVDRDPITGHSQANFTDALFLLEAAYQGEEPRLNQAAANYFRATPGLFNGRFEKTEGLIFFGEEYVNPAKTMVDLYVYEADSIRVSYSRYWHGYLVFLKPLLCLFNYTQIRLLWFAAETLLTAAAIFLFYKKERRALLPFLLMLLLMAPSCVARSLQYCSTYVLMLAGTILVLWSEKEKLYPYLFLVLGILSAYLDLLTAPSISLTVPLCVLCLRKGSGREIGLKQLCLYVVLWGAGYGGMWAAKWVLAWLWQGRAFLEDLFGAVSTRASSAVGESEVSRMEMLRFNLEELFSVSWVNLPVIAYAAAAPLLGLANRKKGERFDALRAGKLCIPFLFPLVWLLVLCNHSYIHSHFTFRILAPCVFALLLALTPAGNPAGGTTKSAA